MSLLICSIKTKTCPTPYSDFLFCLCDGPAKNEHSGSIIITHILMIIQLLSHKGKLSFYTMFVFLYTYLFTQDTFL